MKQAFVVTALVALVLADSASAARVARADRLAIDRTVDAFVDGAVKRRNVDASWNLVTPALRAGTSRSAWDKGNLPVYPYPARGTTFHGWLLNYAYPNDVGFDILLQPTDPKMGAWSFRAEAQKLGGRWRITTWYPVAEYAPPGQPGRVNGPADLGAGGAASADSGESRLGAWVLAIPGVVLLVLVAGVLAVVGVRWRRQRRRVREIERLLAADR